MAFSLIWKDVQLDDSGTGTTLSTASFDSTGYTHAIVFTSHESHSGAAVISDNKSTATWNDLTKQQSGSGTDAYGQLHWGKIGSPGSGHIITMTVDSTADWRVIGVWLVNADSGELELVDETTGADSGSSTNISAGTLSNAEAKDIVSFFASNATAYTDGYTNGTGWTEDYDVANDPYPYLQSRGPEATTSISAYGTSANAITYAAVAASFAEATAPQTASPTSDISAGSWTYSTGSTLYGCVDEATADNADYIYSSTSSDTVKLGGFGLTDPGVDTGFKVKYRVSATSTDQITAYLYEGATLRATDTTRAPGSTPTDYTWNVAEASVANIGTWSDIAVAFTTGTHSGATSTAAKFPTSASSVSESPYDGQTWGANITGITADDTTYATITHPAYDNGVNSYVAYAKGFDFSEIPDGSTITGVEAVICCWVDVNSASGVLAQLLSDAGVRGGTNMWSTPSALSASVGATKTVGGAGQTWGNSLTAAWVKDADFGVAFAIQATANNTDISCDYVTLRVFYTPPAADWRLQWLRLEAPEASVPPGEGVGTTAILPSGVGRMGAGLTKAILPSGIGYMG
jgi:hypothetical protein